MPALQRAGAGSDLAGLTTRATKDGEGWVVSGQKVSDNLCRPGKVRDPARTDGFDPGKARGHLYFVCPMDAAGVTVRRIVDMTGDHAFNEVFLDDVHLGPEHLVGEPGQGMVARQGHAGNGASVVVGEKGRCGVRALTANDLVDELKTSGGVDEPTLRQRVASVWTEGELIG